MLAAIAANLRRLVLRPMSQIVFAQAARDVVSGVTSGESARHFHVRIVAGTRTLLVFAAGPVAGLLQVHHENGSAPRGVCFYEPVPSAGEAICCAPLEVNYVIIAPPAWAAVFVTFAIIVIQFIHKDLQEGQPARLG
jgi:hypothetical protein